MNPRERRSPRFPEPEVTGKTSSLDPILVNKGPAGAARPESPPPTSSLERLLPGQR